MKRVKTIPNILTPSEIEMLIAATKKLRYRVFLLTTYSMGLRLGEALALQAVIRIPGGAFIPVGGHMMATIQASALVQSPAGASSVRGVLVARGQLVPAAADAVTVSLSVRRD